MGANNVSQQIERIRDRIDLLKDRTKPKFIIMFIDASTGERIIRINGFKEIDDDEFDRFSDDIANGEIEMWSILEDIFESTETTNNATAKKEIENDIR